MKRWTDRTDDELQRALNDSRAQLHDAPEHLVQQAIDLFVARRAAAAPGQPLARALQRLVAALVFDSGSAPPLAFGMRSSGGALRQLLYSVQGRDIDLRVAGADDSQFTLSGQILGPDASGTVVLTDERGDGRRESPLSELGEFRLPGVGPGTYVLTLELPELAIELPPVQIPQVA